MFKIKNSTWFTQMGSEKIIGIVYGEWTEQEEDPSEQCYIGTAQGFNQKLDEQHIALTGAKFSVEAFKLITKIQG